MVCSIPREVIPRGIEEGRNNEAFDDGSKRIEIGARSKRDSTSEACRAQESLVLYKYMNEQDGLLMGMQGTQGTEGIQHKA